ncbi:MAG: peptide deformylase [Chloroflexota bacterium]
MTLEIVKMPNGGLREKTRPVAKVDDKLQILIDEMIETMRDAQGVGLAAPQIGRNLRMAVIETLPKEDDDGNEIPDSRDLYVVINPEIVWYSNEIVSGIEGCLSIPGYLGEVDRPDSIRVRALNREGKKVKLKLEGWTARIFQHEIDHLDGVLFIDKLTSPENLWTEEAYRKMQDEVDED